MSRRQMLGFATVCALLAVPNASAASVSTASEVSLATIAPLLCALAIAFFVRRWFIPQQLKNLQVAFEIEDDLLKG